ncbi:MAG: acyltransferase, partial [Proteobacteria bacterium]|nr:acyltransferase [Pseudomonadota bacterium]
FTPLTPRGQLPDDYAISVGLHVLLLHAVNNHHGAVLNVPSWSIAAEFWTYSVFCMCCALARRTAMRVALMAGVGATALAAILWLGDGTGLWQASRMLRCLAGFGLGVCVWAVYAWLPRRVDGWIATVTGISLFALLYVLLANTNNRSPENVLALPLFGMIIWLAAVDQGSLIRRFLEAPPLVALGRWSYSIYMVHFILATSISVLLERGHFTRVDVGNINALMVLPWRWGDVLLMGYLAVVVAVSMMTYRMIEQPWRDIGRRLAARGVPRVTATAASGVAARK